MYLGQTAETYRYLGLVAAYRITLLVALALTQIRCDAHHRKPRQQHEYRCQEPLVVQGQRRDRRQRRITRERAEKARPGQSHRSLAAAISSPRQPLVSDLPVVRPRPSDPASRERRARDVVFDFEDPPESTQACFVLFGEICVLRINKTGLITVRADARPRDHTVPDAMILHVCQQQPIVAVDAALPLFIVGIRAGVTRSEPNPRAP